jgi:hypothetical protein
MYSGTENRRGTFIELILPIKMKSFCRQPYLQKIATKFSHGVSKFRASVIFGILPKLVPLVPDLCFINPVLRAPMQEGVSYIEGVRVLDRMTCYVRMKALHSIFIFL